MLNTMLSPYKQCFLDLIRGHNKAPMEPDTRLEHNDETPPALAKLISYLLLLAMSKLFP